MYVATEIDKQIKAFAPNLRTWQRLALAGVWRDEVARIGGGNDSASYGIGVALYPLEAFMNETQYGTLEDRALTELVSHNRGLGFACCMACTAYAIQER